MIPAPMTPTRSMRSPALTADSCEPIPRTPINLQRRATRRPAPRRVLARRHKRGECPPSDPEHVLIRRITPFCGIPELKAASKRRLRALIVILDTDDVV